jgi:hypothetical protein
LRFTITYDRARTITASADALSTATWPELFDFDRAKQEVIERTELKPFPYRYRQDR